MNPLPIAAADYLRRLELHGIRPGLDLMRALCTELGDPQCAQACITIAGTNGKGSTAAMLHSILTSSGMRVGLYTSPHLVDVTERIRIGDEQIDPDGLAALLAKIEDTATRLLAAGRIERSPTYFEVLTLAAFMHFRDSSCDFAVLEVGMGGRFDATNLADPLLSVITPISFDHEEYLGVTLSSIASEKAGIMRPGRPVISAPQSEEAAAELARQASHCRAPLIFVEPASESRLLLDGRYAIRRTPGEEWIELPLPGAHQIVNASVVLAASAHLAQSGVNDEAIRRGIERCRWPGRLERISVGPEIYLDGCHNPAGASVVASFVRSRNASSSSPRVLVFACMRDKRIREIASVLFPCFDTVVLTTVPDSSRTAPIDQLVKIAEQLGVRYVVEPDLTRIFASSGAWRHDEVQLPPTGLVVVAGSLYLVGAVKAIKASA